MNAQESLTRSELKEIFSEVVSTSEPDDVNPSDEGDHYFMCEAGPVVFGCFFPSSGPFHRQVILVSFTSITENPFEFNNSFNSRSYVARSYVELDDDGTIPQDDDGEFTVKAEFVIPFMGTITADHLKFLLRMWVEDLYVFFQVEAESEDEELDEAETPSDEDVIELITGILLARPNRTAREIARELSVPKNDINRTLYGSLEVFSQDGGQPPRWSLR